MNPRPDPQITDVPVAIVGAGPVGLSLALGLSRHGVRSVLVEREPGTSEHSKAPAIHVRTREVFRQWGVGRRVREAGVLAPVLTLHSADPRRRPLAEVDFSELEPEADRPGLLVLEQAETERLLLEAVREAGLCDVRFGVEAVGLSQDARRATLRLAGDRGEETLTARFVVGCDGAGSFVRDALRLPFDGITYPVRPVLADVRIEDARDALPWPRVLNGARHISAAVRLRPRLWRLIRLERGDPEQGDDVERDAVQEEVSELLGPGPAELVWASRFRIHRRSAPRFRVGRVLLAGDAAHVHSPVGGLGMNGGIQDAHNLAWKLAAALGGGEADRLLDSYETERKAVIVGSVSRYTDVLTRAFLQSPGAVRDAAFALLRTLSRSRRFRLTMLRRTAMLNLDYPSSAVLDGARRAAGVRLPNPLLRSPDGAETRLYDLLPIGPVLIELASTRDAGAPPPLQPVIRVGEGAYADDSGLLRRLLGSADGWILVRPDAYVAWAETRREGLRAAVVRHALGMPPESDERRTP